MADTKNQGGRPTKLTPAIHQTITNHARRGNYIETAAAAAGISKDTFYNWLKRGARYEQPTTAPDDKTIETLAEEGKDWAKDDRKDDRIYRWFSDAIEKAQSEADIRDLTFIDNAALDNWQAAAWKLERRNPNQFGKRTQVEHTGKDGGAIELQIPDDAERQRQVAEILANAGAIADEQ